MKMVKNCKKNTKNRQNYPKMAQNNPKLPKNGPKWYEIFRQMVQMRQGIPTPNFRIKGGKNIDKNWGKFQKLAKMAIKMAKNCRKSIINQFYNEKIIIHCLD